MDERTLKHQREVYQKNLEVLVNEKLALKNRAMQEKALRLKAEEALTATRGKAEFDMRMLKARIEDEVRLQFLKKIAVMEDTY